MELYPGLVEYVKEEILKGTPTKEIYQQAIKKFRYSSNIQAFYKYVAWTKRKHVNDSDLLRTGQTRESLDDKFIDILEKRKTIRGDEICDELSCAPGEIFNLVSSFRDQGYEIIVDGKNIILSSTITAGGEKIEEPLAETDIIFGVMSDLHFGSKMCQITAINKFAAICRKEGVKHILCPGDIFAGYKVYPGQMMEVYAISSKEQEESAAANLPQGFTYYMIGGNHDYSFIKSGGGHNPLLALQALRKDVVYLGFDDASIPIFDGVMARLVHPTGGIPYSNSYRLQKIAAQVIELEHAKISVRNLKIPMTRFLLVGHLHIEVNMMIGAIFSAQCGCFESQTPYLRKKILNPAVGGYIIKATLREDDGIIMKSSATFHSFSDHIEDDWKNYKHSFSKVVKPQPIFS